MQPTLQSWLPDRGTVLLWATWIAVCALGWGLLFQYGTPNGQLSLDSASLFVGTSVVLGVAYGSFCVAGITLARAGFNAMGESTPLRMAPIRAVKVAFALYAIHLGALQVLASFGLWKSFGPWYLGLMPGLWS